MSSLRLPCRACPPSGIPQRPQRVRRATRIPLRVLSRQSTWATDQELRSNQLEASDFRCGGRPPSEGGFPTHDLSHPRPLLRQWCIHALHHPPPRTPADIEAICDPIRSIGRRGLVARDGVAPYIPAMEPGLRSSNFWLLAALFMVSRNSPATGSPFSERKVVSGPSMTCISRDSARPGQSTRRRSTRVENEPIEEAALTAEISAKADPHPR
jgi:hypothetical protein